ALMKKETSTMGRTTVRPIFMARETAPITVRAVGGTSGSMLTICKEIIKTAPIVAYGPTRAANRLRWARAMLNALDVPSLAVTDPAFAQSRVVCNDSIKAE